MLTVHLKFKVYLFQKVIKVKAKLKLASFSIETCLNVRHANLQRLTRKFQYRNLCNCNNTGLKIAIFTCQSVMEKGILVQNSWQNSFELPGLRQQIYDKVLRLTRSRAKHIHIPRFQCLSAGIAGVLKWLMFIISN